MDTSFHLIVNLNGLIYMYILIIGHNASSHYTKNTSKWLNYRPVS